MTYDLQHEPRSTCVLGGTPPKPKQTHPHVDHADLQENLGTALVRATTRHSSKLHLCACVLSGILLLLTAGLPLVDQGFAALGLHNVFHPFPEGIGLALDGGVEAGVRGGGAGAADQSESDSEGGDGRPHGFSGGVVVVEWGSGCVMCGCVMCGLV